MRITNPNPKKLAADKFSLNQIYLKRCLESYTDKIPKKTAETSKTHANFISEIIISSKNSNLTIFLILLLFMLYVVTIDFIIIDKYDNI